MLIKIRLHHRLSLSAVVYTVVPVSHSVKQSFYSNVLVVYSLRVWGVIT